jgi:uncharacterized secreted protein with C-terminal beta-propeller domain
VSDEDAVGGREETAEDEALRALLRAAAGPRPLPAELADELTGLLAVDDVVGQLAAHEATGGSEAAAAAPGLPSDLHARLEASLLGAAEPMPSGVRRRITRVLHPFVGAPVVLRVAAVAIAVVLIAGGLAAAGAWRDDDGQDLRATGPAGAGHEPDDSTSATTVPAEPSEVAAGPPVADGAADPGPAAGSLPPSGPRRPGTTPVATIPGVAAASEQALEPFKDCTELLDQTRAAALAIVGPYGIGGGRGGDQTTAGPAPARATAGGDAAAPQAEAVSADEFSTTNIQEAGVDEPDVLKTDGRRILTLNTNTLRVSRFDDGAPRVEASLVLPSDAYARELFLVGDRAVVLATATDPYRREYPPAAGDDRVAMRWYGSSWTLVYTIDLVAADGPQITSTLLLEGDQTAARLVDGRIRLVVSSPLVSPDFVVPTEDTEEARNEALERNRQIVRQSSAEDWSPRYVRYTGTDPSTAQRGRLCACDRTLRPEVFSGLGTISVVTIDPVRSEPAEAAGVQGAGSVVYASPANLYVTSSRWQPADETPTNSDSTTVHRFDITGTRRARYVGSAGVRGTPLNQFALSEHEGHLRIATTETRWGQPSATGTGPQTESIVTVLALDPGGLHQVGIVGDLGRGERIHAARFIGDVGYVVTFRQTDPLYVIDLRDPTKPAVRGELKTPGYAAYLHPLDDGFLVGIGQDATEQGRRLGAQASTFDVRVPERPAQVDRRSLGEYSSSSVEHDHHAFLYWPRTSTVVVPVWRQPRSSDGSYAPPISDAAVLRVESDHRLTEVGRIAHDGRERREGTSAPYIQRSFVIGDALYTFSDAGLLSSDLRTTADRAWLPF